MDIANQIMVDDSCNIYIVGTSNNGPHSSDILVQKYDSSGKNKWDMIYDGILKQKDVGQYITADDSMNIFVTGFINHSNNRADIPLVKLNRNGMMTQSFFQSGRIADCGAVHLNVSKSKIFLTAACSDYNIAENSSFLLTFDKGGKELEKIMAPVDVQFMISKVIKEKPVIFGHKLTHPESTLIPYISGKDSSGTWEFSDSTVYGLAHITWVDLHKDDVYFLGDDTGDATGTISVFKYKLYPDIKKEIVIPPKPDKRKKR
jgi:hypothetical protein